MILAGDIGGTKTVLGLFESASKTLQTLRIETYASARYGHLEEIIEEFLASSGSRQIKAASFGIAGPVVGKKVILPNLPWVLDSEDLAKTCGLPSVDLCNDLVAAGEGIATLSQEDFVVLQEGLPDIKTGNAILLAPGTGLGMSVLACSLNGFRPLPSEGGHMDFAPRTDEEIELLRSLRKKFGRVSLERILSGPGLHNVYEHLKGSGFAPEQPEIAERMQSGDPAAVISSAALAHACPLCSKSLSMFIEILGATAGNLALLSLATQGVFLGGGIPPKILTALQTGPFMQAFLDKGRFSSLASSFPVRVILNQQTALRGAAQRALHQA